MLDCLIVAMASWITETFSLLTGLGASLQHAAPTLISSSKLWRDFVHFSDERCLRAPCTWFILCEPFNNASKSK